jgi:DNA-binding CsgD family transcriptional regulator
VKKWGQDQNNRLRALSASGMTGSQIAEELGVTRNAVLGRKLRMGISSPWNSCRSPLGRGFSEDDLATIISMCREGKAASEIGLALNRTSHSISVKLGRLRKSGVLLPKWTMPHTAAAISGASS